MAQKGGAKEQLLKQFVTDFAIAIGFQADGEKYKKAWKRLWRDINKIKLFKEKT